MKICRVARWAVTATVAVLAGCGMGGASHVAPSAATLQSTTSSSARAQRFGPAAPLVAHRADAGSAQPDRNPSWMNPSAKAAQLLYVSDYTTSDVTVYGYPAGNLVGKLTGFASPQGACVDAAGNVWITNSAASQILEYAHGGSTPIATLSDPGYFPVGCAVDAKTGDLAVANIETTKHGLPGDVAIYRKAKGTPTYRSDPHFYTVYFVGYDDRGNLFLDGTNAEVGANGAFRYGELPRGSKTIRSITLRGGTIAFPGGVQWDGHAMTVGDQDGAVIYQTAGDAITGKTPLTGSSDVVQYFIDGKTVVGPDAGNGNVEFFGYPGGGSPTKIISGLSSPIGAVVSK